MKRMSVFLCSLALVFVLAGVAGAVPFSDVKSGNWWFDKGNSMTWSFNLDDDKLALGDINSEDIITSSTLAIKFYDDKDPAGEWAKIKTDSRSGIYEIDYGSLYFNVFSKIEKDHRLTVYISALLGDFGVTSLKLSGNYTNIVSGNGANPSTAPVPEPSTILLMGVGLLGLLAVGRRKFNRKE